MTPRIVTPAIIVLAACAQAHADADIRMSTTFLSVTQNSTGLFPIDIDSDNRDEILLFYSNPSRYTVYRADAQARLEQQQTVNYSANFINRIRAADIDADGRTDFVAYAPNATVFEINLNQGNASFAPSTDSPLPSVSALDFNLVDVNADGLPEIITLRSNSFAVFPNLGQGRFAAPVFTTVSTTTTPTAVYAARTRNNAPPAVAVLTTNQLAIYHAQNDDALTYTFHQNLTLPTEGVGIQAADIGSFGRESFLIPARTFAAVMAVRYNPSNNLYTAVVTPGSTISQTNTGMALSQSPDRPRRAAFSFDAIGTPRVLTNNTTENGWFQQSTPMPGVYSSVRHAAFADLLGDANEHLVLASNSTLLSLDPGPDADFASAGFYERIPIDPVQLIPFPNRPFNFLATTNEPQPLSLLTIQPTPQGPAVSVRALPEVVGGGPQRRWAVIDLNGDGLDDIAHIFTTSSTGRVRWQLQRPDTTFQPIQESVISVSTLTNLVAADLNNDGFGDLALLQANGDARVLYGQSDGQLSSADLFPLSTTINPGSLLVADLDNDGLMDLVCSNRLSQTASAAIRVAYGLNPMNYRPPVSFPGPVNAGSTIGGQIDAADLNADGILDIAILSNNGAFLLLSDGPRSYQSPFQILTRTNPIDIRLIDIDNDARPEVVITYSGNSIIAHRDDEGQFTRLHSFLNTTDPRTTTFLDLDSDTFPDVLFTAAIGISAVFNRSAPPCIADYLPDGVVDFFDIVAYLIDFNKQVPATDLNNDGAFNFFDVAAFIRAFTTNCR